MQTNHSHLCGFVTLLAIEYLTTLIQFKDIPEGGNKYNLCPEIYTILLYNESAVV